MVLNPYLKLATETLLKYANPKGGPYFRATHFHKMIFLLYIELKKRNINIKLPYSWYHYGTFVDATEFERQVGIPLSFYVPSGESTNAIEVISYEDISPGVAEIIEYESLRLVESFSDNGVFHEDYLNRLLDLDYRHAPFKFQKIFNRDLKKNLALFKSYNISKEEIEIYIDRLVPTYPYREMHELYDVFLEWDDTIRLALKYKGPSQVIALAEGFWMIYTELLHIKKNENISEDIIEPWAFKFCDMLDEYSAKLEEERNDLLRQYRKNRSNDEPHKIVVDKMNNLAYQLAVNR